ncbi:hypothetical protein NSK_000298 [Nannochloropsis salina CCMP1776]|uniref:Major facilitator superfamily (MFS) profile domain-containing protein n=1 Tax=Nannochloropsis salina CCMP1776 TaxID=1027361 RepID=A0A4D9DIK3_9STRA|nr:hypothetical protein NSK_000298 [Nannochloropsis salina CCMP1776]|eukprot:TFJ88729.1 hypothetical protein NSK_000298 [Nannochloropsis salina CCMP1776]
MGRTHVGKNLPSCQSREFPECSLRTRGSTGLTCSRRSGGAAGIPLRNRAPRCPSPTFVSSFSCHDAIRKPLLSFSQASFSIVPSSRLYASSLPSPKTDEEEEPVPPDAWRLLALSFLCMIICSLDRVAMSVAILPMSLEFGFSETTKGAVSSVFSLGYMSSMLPAGILATSYSPKNVLTLGVALWSLAQILSPSAAHVGLTSLAHNYGLYVLLAWLPTYFSQTYGLDLKQSSVLSVAPWIAAAIVSNLAGWGADTLINSEVVTKTTVRKLFQCSALLIPAVCMTALALGTHTPAEAQAIFTLSVAAGSMSSAGFATATQDLADKYIGITYGATSALSVIVGSLGTFGTGMILDYSHEWPWVFGIAAGVYATGAVAFAQLYKAEKVFD